MESGGLLLVSPHSTNAKGIATSGIDMFLLTLMDVEWVWHVDHRFGIACRNPKKPTRSLQELSLNWDKHDIISTDCMGEVLELDRIHTQLINKPSRFMQII